MKRAQQVMLVGSTLVLSWLGMQATHELGHLSGAWLTGGSVSRLVLHPLTISRTELSSNPHPLVVVWAGPVVGLLLPIIFWAAAVAAHLRGSFLFRFFAGFCLIANGAYIAVGSIDGVGDCGEMLRNGSGAWQLWLFGLLTVPPGFLLWHGEGVHFGFGPSDGKVDAAVTYCTLMAATTLATLELVLGSH